MRLANQLTFALALVVGTLGTTGCELIASADRSKISAGTGAGGAGGEGGEGQGAQGGAGGGQGGAGGGQGGAGGGQGGAGGGMGGAGGGTGGAGGGGPECAVPADCPAPANECEVATCNGGMCGTAPAPAGTQVAMQTAGDCQVVVCDGAGSTTSQADDLDLPDDMLDCTADDCAAGTPAYTPVPAGSGCDDNGGAVCDDMGMCVASWCGDMSVDGMEQCDDGNTVDGDGCDNNCTTTACGNGVQTGTEACDDGNTVEGDGCDTNCTASACGNGITGGAETCDDGNTAGGDGCDAACAVEPNYGCTGAPSVCALAVELYCNDGLDNDGDTLIDCADTDCAAGCDVNFTACAGSQALIVVPSADVPQAITDNATATSDLALGGTPPVVRAAVRLDITHTYDGDLDISLDPPMAAAIDLSSDNGTSGEDYQQTIFDSTCPLPVTSGDAPFADCFAPEGSLTAVNGVGAAGTWTLIVADDASSDTGSLNSWSLVLCTAPLTCGNGALDAAEECDDGNLDNTDACLFDCTAAACGDGYVEAGVEECDDGNLDDTDACTAVCAIAECGDGSLQAGVEVCDDGNLVDGDGCESDCTPTPNCGNGVIDGGEGCDDGDADDGDGCSAGCAVEAGYFCAGAPSVCVTPAEAEPNDTCGAENGPYAPSPSVVIAGAITPVGDQDLYSFTVPAHANVEIETFSGVTPGACVGIDTEIQLRGQDCTTVLLTKDQGAPSGNCSRITPSADAVARQLAPGTYYVNVYDWQNNGTIPAYNVRVTLLSLCGNNTLEPYEACDDGNLVDGDGCESNCTLTPACGNGVVDAGEGCDDGNLSTGDGCDDLCAVEAGYVCNGAPSVCLPLEIEPNNVCGEDDGPFAPDPDAIVVGSITPIGDQDLFSFTLPATASVELETFSGAAQGVCTGIDTVLELRGQDCTTVLLSKDQGGIGNCSRITPSVDAAARRLAPGTYFARVEEYLNNGTIPQYNLRFRVTSLCGNGVQEAYEACDDGNLVDGDGCESDCSICGNGIVEGPGETCDDGNLTAGDGCDGACATEPGYVCNGAGPSVCAPAEAEPNNTFAEADASAVQLMDGGRVGGAISPVADLDTYRLVLSADSVVRFETFAGSGADCLGGVTTTLRIYDAAQAQIYTDTTSGIGSCSEVTANLLAGTYYVRVEETGNNAAVAAYQLEVDVQASAGAETEPNETSVEANALAGSGVFILGGHLVNTDSDYYAITVPAGGASLMAEIVEGSAAETCESNGVDSRLTLFNAALTQLVDDDDDGRGYCSKIDGTGTVTALDSGARNLAAGTYYLQVRASSASTGQTGPGGQFDYRLVVTLRKP